MSFTSTVFSQGQNDKNHNIGFLLGSIIPINYFGVSAIDLTENNSTIKLENRIGYNFGMILKTDYDKNFSVEGGIVFYQRNFKLTGTSANQSNILNDTSSFSYISYGIPLQEIIYVQLGNELYMRNAIGVNIDFYASSVASKGNNFAIDHLSERARWINGSISGNLGIEKRDSKIGSYYVGAEVNIPISAIAVTKLKFYYDGNTFDRYDKLFLRGNYFGIQFKYYLPVGMENSKN